ncbi:hypothetical protein [Synechococcus sp. MIT S9452]|uniref:hypothetical protein n=1 Tax=Synechococcus sp. MIT S9452 TaxID=3082546 RepID=UPI0039A71867
MLSSEDFEPCLWPTCYLPPDLPDTIVLAYASQRHKTLCCITENLSQSLHLDSFTTTYEEYEEISILSECLTTHVNGFPIERMLVDASGIPINYVRLPSPDLDISSLHDQAMILDYHVDYSTRLIRSGIYKQLSNSLVVDASYGLFPSAEWLSQFFPSSRYYFCYGYHLPPTANHKGNGTPNALRLSSTQDWSLPENTILMLQTNHYKFDSSPPQSICFPCNPYKYTYDFLEFLVQLSTKPFIDKIGLTVVESLQISLLQQLIQFGINTSVIQFCTAPSRDQLACSICFDYDIAIDMYKSGGSSLTPLLLSKGLPVYHQFDSSNYFSRIQHENYSYNDLDFLVSNPFSNHC